MKKLSILTAPKAGAILAASALFGLMATTAVADVRIDEAMQLQESGKIKSFEALNQVVMKQHPDATITDTELEDSYGKYVYQVELRDKDGQEWDVDVDATSVGVLQNQKDD